MSHPEDDNVTESEGEGCTPSEKTTDGEKWVYKARPRHWSSYLQGKDDSEVICKNLEGVLSWNRSMLHTQVREHPRALLCNPH